MIQAQFEILAIASCVAAACALLGTFLLLRGMSLMTDAISHSILLGIVLAFFALKNLHSPLLLLAAVATGVLTVAITELIIKSNRLKSDAAIGLVFPLFFSIAVILISKFAGNVHLDTDSVLLGEIAWAPFNRLVLMGLDLGPVSLWTMGSVFVVNVLFVVFFYKELKIATFDKNLATAFGFSPVLIHYLLMTLVSVTTVGAFDAVGSILVVALMITPPATAYLLTDKLSRMLVLSVLIGVVSAILGYILAYGLDANIAGCMATMTGVLFVLTFIFSPRKGLLSKWLQHHQKRLRFSGVLLTVHLLCHENTSEEEVENTVSNMTTHMNWTDRFSRSVIAFVSQKAWITRTGNACRLTALGREKAKTAMTRI